MTAVRSVVACALLLSATAGCDRGGESSSSPATAAQAAPDGPSRDATATATAPTGETATAADGVGPVADAAVPKPTPTPARHGPYAPVFAREIGGWSHAVVITPSGDPLFATGSRLTLLARDDGRELQRAEVSCQIPNDGVVITGDVAVLGCDRGIFEVALPNLSTRQLLRIPRDPYDDQLEAFTAAGDVAAYATRSGKVVVLDREPDRYVPRVEFETKADVESLALTRGAAFVVVGEGGREIDDDGFVGVYDAERGELARRSNTQGRSRMTAVSVSPDDSRVFVHAGSFEASIWDFNANAWRNSFKIGSWLSSSAWIDDTLVVGAGSDGAALFSTELGRTIPLDVPGFDETSMAGVGVSADGSYFCSGDRRGIVACWSDRPVAPSTYEAPAPLTR